MLECVMQEHVGPPGVSLIIAAVSAYIWVFQSYGSEDTAANVQIVALNHINIDAKSIIKSGQVVYGGAGPLADSGGVG